MKNETLLFILRIYIFILFLVYSTTVINAAFTCAYRGMRCFPFSAKPCCLETDVCRFQYGYYECVRKGIKYYNRYVKLNETACRPILEGLCSENNQCIVENSICIDATCQCKPGYFAIYEDTCILTSLEKSCQFNTDCNDRENLKCSDNKICTCKDHYVLLNDTCIPVFNGFCSHNFECKLNGFHCVDNKCQCKPNFILLSEHQCTEMSLVSSCTESVDCGDFWHAKCVKNKCVCTHNHVAINNSTCYPISGGLCWTDHQCPKENFECIDFHCECKKSYVQLSKNLCVPKRFF